MVVAKANSGGEVDSTLQEPERDECDTEGADADRGGLTGRLVVVEGVQHDGSGQWVLSV